MCIKGFGLQWMAVVWRWLRLMDLNTKSRGTRSPLHVQQKDPPDTVWHGKILNIMYSILFLKIYLPAEFDSSICTNALQQHYAVCNHLSYSCAPGTFKVTYALWSLNIYRQCWYAQHFVLSHQRLLQDRSVLYDVIWRTSSWSFDKHQECISRWISSPLDTQNNFGSCGDDTYGLFDSFRQRDVKQRTK